MADIRELEEALGLKFDNLSLLEQALTHRSFINENPDFPLPSNERLEFLGDALLNLFVTEKLYYLSPPLSEGRMSKLRAALICEETLSSLALSLKLGEYLKLGKGEEASGGRKRPSNLSRAFEALIGAIFLDKGIEKTEEAFWRLFDAKWRKVLAGEVILDYKSQLQEYLHQRRLPTPIYRVVEEKGPPHRKSFTIEVLVGDITIGKGCGENKKKAEMEAARSALISLEQKEVI